PTSSPQCATPGKSPSPASRVPTASPALLDEALWDGDGRDRHEALALLAVDRDRQQVRVTGCADGERAEDAARDREAEDSLRRRAPAPPALGDRRQDHVHRLRAVRGVRVRRRPDLLAELLDEHLAGARQLVRRLAGDADVRALPDRAVRVRVAEAVRHLELDSRIDALDVLHQLRAVVADDPAQEDDLRAGLLDRARQRLVARRLGVPALEPEDLQAELLRGRLVSRGDAEA